MFYDELRSGGLRVIVSLNGISTPFILEILVHAYSAILVWMSKWWHFWANIFGVVFRQKLFFPPKKVLKLNCHGSCAWRMLIRAEKTQIPINRKMSQGRRAKAYADILPIIWEADYQYLEKSIERKKILSWK